MRTSIAPFITNLFMNVAKEAKESNLHIRDGLRKMEVHSFLQEKQAHKNVYIDVWLNFG